MEIKMREILFVRDRWGELWVRYFFLILLINGQAGTDKK